MVFLPSSLVLSHHLPSPTLLSACLPSDPLTSLCLLTLSLPLSAPSLRGSSILTITPVLISQSPTLIRWRRKSSSVPTHRNPIPMRTLGISFWPTLSWPINVSVVDVLSGSRTTSKKTFWVLWIGVCRWTWTLMSLGVGERSPTPSVTRRQWGWVSLGRSTR